MCRPFLSRTQAAAATSRPIPRSWPSPRIPIRFRPSRTSAQIYTLDLTNPAAKPVKVSTSAGGNFNPAYSPDGKYIAWRSQARAGYESDKFRLVVYDRQKKTTKDLHTETSTTGSMNLLGRQIRRRSISSPEIRRISDLSGRCRHCRESEHSCIDCRCRRI